MDPITRGAQRFLAEIEAFWRQGGGRVLPLIADNRVRSEMTKALRLGELAPENRRPLFLYEAPFVEARSYFDGLVEAVMVQYEAVRKGVAEEGVRIPAFSMDGTTLTGPERAIFAVERAAMLLGERFDGIFVALVPGDVANGAAWRKGIARLCHLSRSSRVRLAVYAPPNGPLNGVLCDRGARFEIDQAALVAYLKHLGTRKSEGPNGASAERSPKGLGDATQQTEAPPAAVKLRGLLLDAAEASAKGDPVGAASRCLEARALCAAEGLVLEEAMVLVGLAGACLGAVQPELAIESYTRAAELAATKDAWQVVSQAWLGVAGAHLATKRHELAATAYRQAGAAATRGKDRILRIEALRMRGTCHVLAGNEADAILAWKEAIDLGATLEAGEREASTLSEIAAPLQRLLMRLGLAAQAVHIALVGVAAERP